MPLPVGSDRIGSARLITGQSRLVSYPTQKGLFTIRLDPLT